MTDRDGVLRLGIVGCGAVTARYHLPALIASPEARIVACADPAIERARALAELVAEHAELPRAVASHHELIGQVDLALVAVPNAWHEPVAVDLLRAGVPVLVEKPMARTVAECDRMLAAAAASGAVLAVGHDFRYFPIARFAREVFAAGLLGPLRRVDVRQSAGGRWPYASAASLSPTAGGGVLLDFGVHVFDLLLWWLGDLRPRSYEDDAARGIEGECTAELELAGGVPLHFELSRSRRLRDTIVVEGERGTIEIGVFEPATVKLSLPHGESGLVGGVPDAAFERAPLTEVFGRQLRDVVAAVRGQRPPLVTGEDGRRAVAVAEQCYAMRRLMRHPWDYPDAFAAAERGA